MHSTIAESAEETFSTPAWVHDAVFYQIFPDRFARSESVAKPANLEPWDAPPTVHGFKGGDLLGVVEHLDHLTDLGITAIYLCPIFTSTANHRYHTYDYFSVDPILGGNGAFRTLLDEAHRRDMKVVLDGVFNHCGRGFFQFNHILENGASSPYLDWFTVYRWPLHPYGPADAKPGYWAWWDDPALPKFKTDTAAVREFLLSVGEYWVRQGIDGWRLDVPNEIDDDSFWREFRQRVKSANPDAYLVGEIWGDARRWLGGDQFDGVMNYSFTRLALGFLSGHRGIDVDAVSGTGLNSIDSMDGVTFGHGIEHMLGQYPWPVTLAQLNLLDSHDTPRYLSMAREDESSLRLAYLLQMTIPGAPCIYYGDEVGMAGGETVEAARGGFQWERSHWNEDLLAWIRRCIALRRDHPVLRVGGYRTVYAEGQVFVFARELAQEVAIVAINAGETAVTLTVPLPPQLSSFTGVTACAGTSGTVSDRCISGWTIAARAADVLLGHVVR